MKIYLAGPLFTLAEREWNRDFADSLIDSLQSREITAEITLPQEDCAECFKEPVPESWSDIPHEPHNPWPCVYQRCIAGVETADVVVAILDGADSDSGTCYEAGYAKGKGKPVIGLRTDIRPTEDKGSNAMLARGCDAVVVIGISEDTRSAAERVAAAVVQLELN